MAFMTTRCRPWPLRLSIAVAMLFLTALSTASADTKGVVILQSYGQNFKPWSEYSKALRQQLERTSPWQLDFQEFSVSTARSENEDAEVQFTEYLRALFAHHAPDLIVAFGGPAGAFVQRQRAALFPTTPMVLTAIDRRRVQESALTRNDTVVAVRQDIAVLFGNILHLLPDTKTVAVVIGNSPNERFWINAIQTELEPLKSRINLLFLNELSFEDILKRAASLPPSSAIWWNQPQVDGKGAAHEGDGALKALYAVANAPIFSYDDSFLQGEIVGGPMTSVSDGARITSQVVLRILGGEIPAEIKTPTLEYGAPKFDWRQLQRWGISESRLPPGSEIYFREPTAWAKYHWEILLACAVVLTQGILITGLLHERRRRQLAEVLSRQRMAELAHVNRYTIVRQLTASIADELSQPLGAILMNSETAELLLKSPEADLDEMGEILADIRRDDGRASEVIHRLRTLLKRHPSELRPLDVNELVLETVEFLSGLALVRGVKLNGTVHSSPLRIDGHRIELQQVIINLFVNAMDAMSVMPRLQHAVTICTARIDNFAEISVSDSGPGIPADRVADVFEPFHTTKPNGMGMGLSIARTIVEAHNGRIWADNQEGLGAVFRINLPLSRAENATALYGARKGSTG